MGTEVGGPDCVEMGPGEQRRASGEARESRIVETPPTLAQAALAKQGGVEKERLRQARGRGLGGRDVVMWPGAPTDLGQQAGAERELRWVCWAEREAGRQGRVETESWRPGGLERGRQAAEGGARAMRVQGHWEEVAAAGSRRWRM